jgi:YidC/Oxa1 family membrane protein insertase
MNSIRYIILGGLAVVSYLLLLAWQADYSAAPQNSTPRPELTQNQPLSDIPAAPQSADIPAPLASGSNADIPVVSLSPAPAGAAVSGNTNIHVRTDVLDLIIDRVGGDIVYVALPQHRTRIDVADDPFVLLENTSLRTYVAQSGLVGLNGIDSSGRALYTSNANDFQLSERDNSLDVALTYTDTNGVEIIKRFRFERGSYLIDIYYEINNPTATPWQANLFGQIKRNNFADPTQGSGLGMRSYLGFATTRTDDPYTKIAFSDIDSGQPSHETVGGWIAFSQHYFLSAWIPPADRLNSISTRKNNLNEYFGGFTSSEFVVAPQSTSVQKAQFYAGPKDQYQLREVAEHLDLTIDYGWLWFIASPIYWLLTQINSVVGNYGWSILLLTLTVKGIFYKLSATSYRSMANMRRVMPKMTQLKERYGDDKMKLQKATMELYQKEKINPFGGCLPMLVQMPVFIALYWVLMESVELRHAPFILWIKDLSVMDPFFVLPLLMGASMYAQSLLSPAPSDPMQAKIMRFMPVAMTVFFLWFPAGLVLYWLANSVLGIAQQWYITQKLEKEYAAKEAKNH